MIFQRALSPLTLPFAQAEHWLHSTPRKAALSSFATTHGCFRLSRLCSLSGCGSIFHTQDQTGKASSLAA